MGRPRITADQRALAVALLANAIRKDDHLRARGEAFAPRHAVAPALRGDAAGQYVRGMLDLLAVLFAGGRPLADDCHAAARDLARNGGDEPPRAQP